MMARIKKIDKPFLIITSILVLFGFIIFLSASLGITAKEHLKFSSIVLNQLFLGLILGSISAFINSRVHYSFWKKSSLWIFIGSIILTLLVFVPGIGFASGGAHRWIIIGPLSFQPAELLKISFILYFATWLSNAKHHIQTFKYGVIPFGIISGIVGVIMLLQPDTDSFVVMVIAGLTMFYVAGAKWKHLAMIGLVGILCFSFLVATRPYVKQRVMTFINPASDPLQSGYQIQQSLIAIGSGGFAGRGFGQSIQKFSFLPEPIGDSIFAVAAEEFGFIGSVILIALFTSFTIRGYKIGTRLEDSFGSLVMIGLVTIIVTQSFMNIASMLGLIPLSGLPLLFVSHGGTALFFSLTSVGILMNISKYQKVT